MKQSLITNITPLPTNISRETAVAQLHDHHAMIELNPLVIRHERTSPPPNASPDEAELGTWYFITDKINYLPGGVVTGEISYKACFYNLPNGIQTHVFAPAGVEIKSKWFVGGNIPGEAREASELGVLKPKEGLYLREELDLRCNILMSNFVKRNLKKSHHVVVDKIIEKADQQQEELKFSPGSPLSDHAGSRPPPVHELFGSAPTVPIGLNSKPTSPNDLQSREVQLSCACEGTVHLSECIYFHPDDLQDHEPSPSRPSMPWNPIFPPASASSYSAPSIAAPQNLERAISELYGSTGPGQCHSTGALHDPGLRLRTFTPSILLSNLSPSSSSGQQTPQNHTAPSSAIPVVETTDPTLRY